MHEIFVVNLAEQFGDATFKKHSTRLSVFNFALSALMQTGDGGVSVKLDGQGTGACPCLCTLRVSIYFLCENVCLTSYTLQKDYKTKKAVSTGTLLPINIAFCYLNELCYAHELLRINWLCHKLRQGRITVPN